MCGEHSRTSASIPSHPCSNGLPACNRPLRCRHGGGADAKLRTTSGLQAPLGFRTEYGASMGARELPHMCTSSALGHKSFGNSQTLGSTLQDTKEPLIKVQPPEACPAAKLCDRLATEAMPGHLLV